MRFLLLRCLALGIALGSMVQSALCNVAPTPQEIAQGFRDGLVIAQPRAERRASSDSAEPAEGLTRRRQFSRFRNLRVLQLASGDTVAGAVARLRATGRYEYVEPDRLLYSRAVPNDPSFDQQWSLRNTGQNGGTPGADIGAVDAWALRTNAATDITRGSVIIAIIDSGMRLTHTDLAANLWSDINGNHGINPTLSSGSSLYYQPSDDQGHGTHVAGIMGAIGNNSKGIAGVAWTAQLMPLKFMDASGSGSTSSEIDCIDYAIANGVKVINASYGSSTYSNAELQAIQSARAAGIIFVTAAGNSGLNTDNGNDYPAAYPLDNIVAVAATDNRDALTSFSNYGSGSVDIAAPGDAIYSTYNRSDTDYMTLSGTSMAAPHVTGAIALLRAQFPSDTYRQTINRLLRATTKLPGLAGKVQTGGRLNLAKALTSTNNRPFNDDFADRALLAGSNIQVRSSNVGATIETGETINSGLANATNSLWWTWTALETTQIVIDTAGSSYDTVLAVYTGATLSSLQTVAANDDASASTTTSRVSVDVAAGTAYQIAVAGKAGATGFTALHLAQIPPNESFARAITLTGNSVQIAGNNLNATREAGEPDPTGTGGGHTVWYKWTAPATGHFVLNAYSAEMDTVAAVYTGTSLGGLVTVASNDNPYTVSASAFSSDALVPFNATAGTTYYCQIDNSTSDTVSGGDFMLTLSDALWARPAVAEITGSPAVGSDGTIYFGSLDKAIYAVNTVGTIKWRYETVGTVDGATPAIGSDGTVYVGSSDGVVYALNGSTGAKKWQMTANSAISSSAAIGRDGTIYVHDDTALFALSPDSTIKWTYPLNTSPSGGTYCSPSIGADGTIYIGAIGGQFLALTDSSTSATVKWTFTADGDIYTSPGLGADGTIYFATLKGTVYALHTDGTVKWSWRTADATAITSSPAVGADGTIYFAGYDHKLHAVNRQGNEVWNYLLGNEVRSSSPAIAADGTIYIGAYDGLLYAINPDGTLQRTYPTAQQIRSSPVIANKRLYFGSSDNRLYAYAINQDAAGTSWPMLRQNSLRTGRAATNSIDVISPPQGHAVMVGSTLSLSVTASSSGTLSYLWYKDGAPISGATSSTYSVTNATSANAGTYTVAITGIAGSVTSRAAIVIITGQPMITSQPVEVAVTLGGNATVSVAAAGTGVSFQWYRAGQVILGNASSKTSALMITNASTSDAGVYDCVVTDSAGGSELSRPVVIGVLPPTGSRTAGAVTTRDAWKDIHHPNGNIYDQFLLAGSSGTFTAAAGKIARMSFLDENQSIVQVEMSGAGAITVVLDNASGPMAPALYNQSGIQYMMGKATIILGGADTTTHFTIYSVGTVTNPGVTRSDVSYVGWANVALAGIVSTDGKLGGIHQGNAFYNSATGFTGIYAPTVSTAASLLVVHDIAASGTAQAYLYFGNGGAINVKIAGSALAQPNGGNIAVGGLGQVQMGAGQDSCGHPAAAQSIQTTLANDAGTNLTSSLVVGP